MCGEPVGGIAEYLQRETAFQRSGDEGKGGIIADLDMAGSGQQQFLDGDLGRCAFVKHFVSRFEDGHIDTLLPTQFPGRPGCIIAFHHGPHLFHGFLHTNALAAGESIPTTERGVDITLLMELHDWFIRLTIPLGALMVFHATRARREIRFPEEAEEPLLTVAEYEARRAASAQAAAAQAAAAADTAASEAAPEETASSDPENRKEEAHE